MLEEAEVWPVAGWSVFGSGVSIRCWPGRSEEGGNSREATGRRSLAPGPAFPPALGFALLAVLGVGVGGEDDRHPPFHSQRQDAVRDGLADDGREGGDP